MSIPTTDGHIEVDGKTIEIVPGSMVWQISPEPIDHQWAERINQGIRQARGWSVVIEISWGDGQTSHAPTGPVVEGSLAK